ncbi:hypothetical protein ADK51_12805 [Streptomyces sp. WM6368]|nr:hypothetical protein ADK51_12805 [Streptomyces sp. WM6368]
MKERFWDVSRRQPFEGWHYLGNRTLVIGEEHYGPLRSCTMDALPSMHRQLARQTCYPTAESSAYR